jgi:hypothetical protein
MSAFTMEEAAATIGKRVRSMVDIAGVTSIMVSTVIRADAVDEGYIVGVVWDLAERLFGDRFSKDDDEERLAEPTEPCGNLCVGAGHGHRQCRLGKMRGRGGLSDAG